jgi:uncharacterized oxidoreductase
MLIAHDHLKTLVTAVFEKAGCGAAEAERIGHYLVEANLAGHDSHGVIRVPTYVEWLKAGKVVADQHIKIVFENDVIAVVDGQAGFGQVIGEEATKLGIAKAKKQGVAVVALRNAGHIGQIGAWARMCAEAGLVSLHFVNTSGAGILVSPFGGTERRLSANPIAAGVPRPGNMPIIMDISTSVVAEGKVRVAKNKGVTVPDGCLIDAKGRPTNNPNDLYGPPQGAILPFGGHKGYSLGVIAEVLAGALTGGSCSNPAEKRVINNMLTILLAPAFFQVDGYFKSEVDRFVEWVKSSATVTPDGKILMPGEPEELTRRQRLAEGIHLDDTTWKQISEVCVSLGVPLPTEGGKHYRGCRG